MKKTRRKIDIDPDITLGLDLATSALIAGGNCGNCGNLKEDNMCYKLRRKGQVRNDLKNVCSYYEKKA